MVNNVALDTLSGSTILIARKPKDLIFADKEANIAPPEPESPAVILNISGNEETDTAGTYSRNDILSAGQESIEQENPLELTAEEEDMVNQLKARDQEVRQHEQSHVAMLGPYARSAPKYVYQMGPDGKLYAVGGSVEADVSDAGSPAANLLKARMLRSAALAGGDASGADMAGAMKANDLIGKAMRQMNE